VHRPRLRSAVKFTSSAATIARDWGLVEKEESDRVGGGRDG
jgi:hypothetical protein